MAPKSETKQLTRAERQVLANELDQDVSRAYESIAEYRGKAHDPERLRVMEADYRELVKRYQAARVAAESPDAP